MAWLYVEIYKINLILQVEIALYDRSGAWTPIGGGGISSPWKFLGIYILMQTEKTYLPSVLCTTRKTSLKGPTMHYA